MNADCLPITAVPGLSRIFADFCAGNSNVQAFYGASSRDRRYLHDPSKTSPQSPEHRSRLTDLLVSQNPSPALVPALEKIRLGARVTVTGQQVGIIGGPLYVPHKAVTAIALASEGDRAGQPHQPIFWLASEDHDFAEINHVNFPIRHGFTQLRYEAAPHAAVPVGGLILNDSITPLVEQAAEILGYSDTTDWLAAAYRPGQTLAQAFAEFYGKVFEAQGLLIFDASGREAHRLGAGVLRAAIERAQELHSALVERNRELQSAGYHAQVAVADHGSLLFLIDPQSGARNALKRTEPSAAEPDGLWQAGRQRLSTEELLGILESEPERISPSALLRPVFQDQILPTSAYVGGPAEVAYFAQSSVLYQRILGRITLVLPRLSATLVEPAIAQLLDRHELQVETVFQQTESSLAQLLAARAMPIAGKQKLSKAGNALDQELTALTEYMSSVDEGLGRAADVSASKMRYQMNRLRRLAANFELQKETSLNRHAQALTHALYPHHGLQERHVGAAYYLARYGSGLIETLVAEAGDSCPGHKLIRL